MSACDTVSLKDQRCLPPPLTTTTALWSRGLCYNAGASGKHIASQNFQHDENRQKIIIVTYRTACVQIRSQCHGRISQLRRPTGRTSISFAQRGQGPWKWLCRVTAINLTQSADPPLPSFPTLCLTCCQLSHALCKSVFTEYAGVHAYASQQSACEGMPKCLETSTSLTSIDMPACFHHSWRQPMWTNVLQRHAV